MKKIVSNDGFTMIEVMVSMVVLTVSLLLLLNMAMLSLEGNDFSNRATASTQLIQEKLEELRTDKDPESGNDTIQGISRAWRVTSVASHLRRIDITATWENHQGRTLQNTMSAYVRTNSI